MDKLALLLTPIFALNQQPAIKFAKQFYLVSFGVFGAFAVFISICLSVYLFKLTFPTFSNGQEAWLLLIPAWVIIVSKLFHIVVVGKSFWKTPWQQLKKQRFIPKVV